MTTFSEAIKTNIYIDQTHYFEELGHRKPNNLSDNFKIGDEVRLVNGFAKQIVKAIIRANGIRYLKCSYPSYRKELEFRPETDFVHYVETDLANDIQELNEIENKLEELPMKDKLYVTREGNRYGTGLAIDSDGKYVLKMQDNGAFEAFDESSIKRVMPYTFDVNFVTGDRTAATYSYRGKEGQVEVGDILILDTTFSIARVVAVNTENEAATKEFAGRKLKTEAL